MIIIKLMIIAIIFYVIMRRICIIFDWLEEYERHGIYHEKFSSRGEDNSEKTN